MQKRAFLITVSILIFLWNTSCGKRTAEIPPNYGTLDALFDQTENLLIVQGTHGFATENQVLSKWAHLLQNVYKRRGIEVPLVIDTECDAESSKNKHLLLVGRPEANTVLKEYLRGLPVYFGRNMVLLEDKVSQMVFGDGAQVCFAVPAPTNSERLLGIFAIIYEKEIEKMWWSAAPYGEYADYLMWQPTKGPTAGGGYTYRGMFRNISSDKELLAQIFVLKSETLRRYQDNAFLKLAEINRSAEEEKITQVKPNRRLDHFQREIDVKEAKVFFHHSPLLDYMFLLYINPSWKGINFERLLHLSIPLGRAGLVTLPEYAIVDNLTHYSQLYDLVKMYESSSKTERMLTHSRHPPSYEGMVHILKKGEISYRRFSKLWKQYISPREQKIIQRWEQEFETSQPLHCLQKLTGLQWPYDELHLCISAFHPSGSALVGNPFVFTGFFNEEKLTPDSAWLIGHEGTHLLLEAHEADWKKTPKGQEVIQKWGEDAEEAVCLLLQSRLAWLCGFIGEKNIQYFDPADSDNFIRLAGAMAQHWDDYMNDTQKYPTIIDFMIDIALKTK